MHFLAFWFKKGIQPEPLMKWAPLDHVNNFFWFKQK